MPLTCQALGQALRGNLLGLMKVLSKLIRFEGQSVLPVFLEARLTGVNSVVYWLKKTGLCLKWKEKRELTHSKKEEWRMKVEVSPSRTTRWVGSSKQQMYLVCRLEVWYPNVSRMVVALKAQETILHCLSCILVGIMNHSFCHFFLKYQCNDFIYQLRTSYLYIMFSFSRQVSVYCLEVVLELSL